MTGPSAASRLQQLSGQLSIFDVLPEPQPAAEEASEFIRWLDAQDEAA